MPTNIVSSICDDRGEEPTYNGVDMSTLIQGEPSCLIAVALSNLSMAVPQSL